MIPPKIGQNVHKQVDLKFLSKSHRTYVFIRPPFLPVPDCDVETLFGKVGGRGWVDKLLVEIWAQAFPFDRGHIFRMFVHRMEDPAEIKTFKD